MHPGMAINRLGRMAENGGPGEGCRVRQGRPPRFTPEQLKELELDMKKPPRHCGPDPDTWTSRTVARRAFAKFGIKVAYPSMRRILTRAKTDWPGSAAAPARSPDKP